MHSYVGCSGAHRGSMVQVMNEGAFRQNRLRLANLDPASEISGIVRHTNIVGHPLPPVGQGAGPMQVPDDLVVPNVGDVPQNFPHTVSAALGLSMDALNRLAIIYNSHFGIVPADLLRERILKFLAFSQGD
jgi:hypothetical protein